MTVHSPIALPHSAFTPERRVQFLDILASNGNVRSACLLTGISPQAAYKARRRDARFAAGWDGALLLAREHAESVLADRAINGVEEVIYYRGEEVGRRMKYDNRLLLALLGRLDRRCENTRAEEAAERFDEILAMIAGAEPEAELVEAASPDSADTGLAASRSEYREWLAERAIERAEVARNDSNAPAPAAVGQDAVRQDAWGPDALDQAEDEARAQADRACDRWEARAFATVDAICEEQVDRPEAGEESSVPAGTRSFDQDSVNPVNQSADDEDYPFPEASWRAFLGRPIREEDRGPRIRIP